MTSNDPLSGLTEFQKGYVEAMFFTESGEPESPLHGLTLDDLTGEALARVILDCAGFVLQTDEGEIDQYGEREAGRDFWFTRNGHGVGFWEEDYGTLEICAKFDAIAKSMGGVYVYIGDDEEVYFL